MPADAAAVLVAAGSGDRLARGVPKALVSLGGVPLVRRAAERLASVPQIGLLVVAAPPGDAAQRVREALGGLDVSLRVVPGGARRRDSVREGLGETGGWPLVVVHDAARPLARRELCEIVLDAARRDGAAVPAVRVPDTLIRETDGLVDDVIERQSVRAVQTPQAFARDLLLRAHDAAARDWDAPDDGSMVLGLGERVTVVDGDPDNMKITWPDDLERAESTLARRAGDGTAGPGIERRVGLGWDVHPIVPGRPFPLAGVIVDESAGPAGHSDGDPLAHAVADALLGAAAAGDIGQLFPDDDPANEGLPGRDLLARTRVALAEAGWQPIQVDAVLITDRPKIAPHRDAIRAALADVLGIPMERVSLKGKRTEGLGALSGGAGVCCHAIAQVGTRPGR